MSTRFLSAVLPVLFLASMAAAQTLTPQEPAPSAEPGPAVHPDSPVPVLVGSVTREGIEEAVPDWVQAEVEAAPDPAAAQALAAAGADCEVTVYLGTWCGDSRRELARLWRAVDLAGGSLPFKVTYVAVDRTKKEPADKVAGVDLRYVPTFVVQRGGREVGRIVEQSPHGIEGDLLALVTGKAEGVISARTDLGPEQPQP